MTITERPRTLPTIPRFDGVLPDPGATIWRASFSPAAALRVLADIDHAYGQRLADDRPAIAGMLECDGAVTLYCWTRHIESLLLMILLDAGGQPRNADLHAIYGKCWIEPRRLGPTLAALVAGMGRR